MDNHSGPQTFDEFEREVAPMLAPPPAPFVSKFGGRFIHDFAGEKPTRDWLVKDAPVIKGYQAEINAIRLLLGLKPMWSAA